MSSHTQSLSYRLSNRRPAGLAALAALVATIAFAIFGLNSSAMAADAPTAGGWIRIAHLSPDTKAVDVTLTALAGGAKVYELDDLAYGAVSAYVAMSQGTYVVAMVPTGSPANTPAMIQQSINVVSGQPMTVAALGKNSDLKTVVFPDDLTPPAAGQARVRVIQASTDVSSVSIATSTGQPVTADAKQGTATGYASVPAGTWNLDLTGAASPATASVTLASGAVATLFVLDNSTGGVTIKPVIDSASVGATPVGGIQTGGGFLAHHINAAPSADSVLLGVTIALAAALLIALGVLSAARRRESTR
ncbi:DUF4397 domain-containing protein [Subtercola lobariae]|uniref:Peptidase n=1 Tax=Subtercola lobariae TaxID=1588641 RepID=A0A917BGL1_9MICO|nr:DUF4397 domain-containing protein [Subtercola lobariae]GGF41489.1 peptidase [Subtercola lobariae]